MRFKDLDRGELVAIVGGVLLAISLALTWYRLGNHNARLATCRGPDTTCSGWVALPIIRYLLVVAAAAPAILAYIIIRGHALSWPRGELTAVVALIALTTTLFLGPISRPGTPRGEISLEIGWYIALVADLLILAGSIFRTQQSSARRKPPGVL